MLRIAIRYSCLAFLAVMLFFAFKGGPAEAKSVYVIADINATPTPIKAYNINPDGTLTFQAEYGVPYHGGGAVGLAMAVDASYETLFVTYEVSNTIQLLDARTMTDLGTATAAGASDLAGVVYDQVKKLLYTVDRRTSNLFVYRWDPVTRTLTLDSQQTLTGLGTSGAWGLALDRNNNHLYVSSMSTVIPYYNTSNWSQAGSITVAGTAIGVAVDNKNRLVYSGAGWASNYNLDQYNQVTGAKQSLALGTFVGIMGLGVDDNTGLVYCTTGYNGDDLRVYNSALQLQQNLGTIGSAPTGLVVPTVEGGFNALNFAKQANQSQAPPGGNLTYTLSFDNLNNPSTPVHNVTISDNLPAETTFVSATGGGTYQATTHSVEWFIGTLSPGQPGQSVQLVAQVKPTTPSGTQITNFATITSAETAPTTKSVVTNVQAVSFMAFPIPGYTPTTAPVNAVMDNSVLERSDPQTRLFYTVFPSGNIIKAFNGETGDQQYGQKYMDPWGAYWLALPNSAGTDFFPASGSGSRPLNYTTGPDGKYLSYAGNAGYNFLAPADTQVLATADGKLYKCTAADDPVNGGGYDAFYNSYIDHQNGYYSWYLYTVLNSAIESEIAGKGYADVVKGQVIGNIIALYGLPGRLHFEMRANGFDHANVVDPYKLGLWASAPVITGHLEPIFPLLLSDTPGGVAPQNVAPPSWVPAFLLPPVAAPPKAAPPITRPPVHAPPR